jgi:hypothetical protein
MKYFEVLVQVRTESEDSKGNVKVKKNSELYLVDAMSVTEAEARVVKLFSNSTFDFEVVSVRNSKVLEVVNYEEPKKKAVEITTMKEVDLDTIEEKDNQI